MHTFDTIINRVKDMTDDVNVYISNDKEWVKFSSLSGHINDDYFSITLMDDGNTIELRVEETTDNKEYWYEFLKQYVKVVIK